jgi:NAD(P)H-dependent flavin oxidoreductase YrpB (nitropropane dioxygenase family)
MPHVSSRPVVIQGGMGVAVSSWRLASAVARTGQLGVVSGTALDTVLARRLQDGDRGGHMRRAMDHFPVPIVAERVWERYYRPGGRPQGRPYRPVPKLTLHQTAGIQELAVVGNFAEVWLAKQGHDGPVGVNYLEKVQMATPAAALGAMLAGVDYVLMGAGIPREIPRLLDDLAAGRVGRVNVEVHGASGQYGVEVDPAALLGADLQKLPRPQFLAIVSLDMLAAYLARDPGTRPDGFVVEGPTAGGHNAPPRGRLQLDETGQPVYGPRDQANLEKMAELGLPFWLAGGHGTPRLLAAALAMGAQGIQAGTLFALCQESGLASGLRGRLLEDLAADRLTVRTDPLASPTAFPFKVATLSGTQSDEAVYAERPRLCDLGYLRTPFEDAQGRVGYRCASEPVHMFVRKGGEVDDTAGRKCLCNALTANVGLAQNRTDGYTETPLVTLGTDLHGARALGQLHPAGWSAAQARDWLLRGERRDTAVAEVVGATRSLT